MPEAPTKPCDISRDAVDRLQPPSVTARTVFIELGKGRYCSQAEHEHSSCSMRKSAVQIGIELCSLSTHMDPDACRHGLLCYAAVSIKVPQIV